jgi:membrane associated rhomboid family serine protease
MTENQKKTAIPATNSPSAPIFNVPGVVLVAICLLFAIHALRHFGGESIDIWSVYTFAFSPMRFNPETAIPFLPFSQWWSFLTYALLHVDLTHLIFNSLWLLVFATPVVRLFGTARFLLIVALAAIAGAAAHLFVHWPDRTMLLGASGSVSGLTAAALPIMYGSGNLKGTTRPHETLSFSEYISSSRALIFTVLWFGLQLVPQAFMRLSGIVTQTAFLDERPVAWEAHVGGFLAGLAAFFTLRHFLLGRRSVR